MFTLIIKKSKSKNFNEAVTCAISLGGTYNGKEIRIQVEKELEAYATLLPIFQYNVLSWAGTTAYHNQKQVHPYKFLFHKYLFRRTAIAEVNSQLFNSDFVSKTYIYVKRKQNVFYFKNEDFSFVISLKGKQLYDFIDQCNIGDEVVFD